MSKRYALGLLLALLWPFHIPTAGFAAETLIREIHVLKSEDGDTRIILRSPLMLAYANELSRLSPGQPLVAPFLKTESKEARPVSRLDRQAIFDNYERFSDFLLRDFRFSVDGNPVMPEFPEYVIVETGYPDDSNVGAIPGLMASASMLAVCTVNFPEQPEIAESLVVISFFLADVMPWDTLKIEHPVPAFPEPEGVVFQTRITDYRNGAAATIHFDGPGFEPVTLTGSTTAMLMQSVHKVEHLILSRYGQMLLLLCLVVAGASLGYYVLRRNRH